MPPAPSDPAPRPPAEPLANSLASSLASARLPHSSFSRYELEEEVGRGAMGVVYRARHGGTGVEVALKLIRGPGRVEPRDMARFAREAKLLGRVSHPGIVQVLDAGVEANVPFIALAFVRGKPLSQVKLPFEAQIALLAKVGRAVGAAHAASIVHRDLKPSNILVDEATGEPRVVDFGLAFDAKVDATRLSQTGELLGTPAYMPPEAIRGGGRPDDPRIDVYALGVMLHESLAGEHPFYARGDVVPDVFKKIERGAPSLVGRSGVDLLLADLAERALAADPARRPPDGDAFALELEEWLAGARAERPRQTVPVLLAVLALACVGGTTALLLATKRRAPVPPVAPRVPPPPTFAPDFLVTALQALARECEATERGDLEDLEKRSRDLAEHFPEDGRPLSIAGFAATGRPGFEHAARRELVRARRLTPLLGPEESSREIRLSWMLGFERAAVALAERRYPGIATQPPAIQNLLMHFYLKAAAPVADPRRAEALATILLAAKTPGSINVYPECHLLEMARANARVGLGDAEGAVGFYLEAAKTAPGRGPDYFAHLAREARVSGVNPADMGRSFFVYWMTTPFCREVARIDGFRDSEDPFGAGRAYTELAGREAVAGQPEHAALAYLRAARAFDLARSPEKVAASLESALALDLAGALDTRALVCTTAARALQGSDRERAEKLALEACAPAPKGSFDPRTPDELADAWALVARARLAQGDRPGARKALDNAHALAPCDAREEDELSVRIGKP